jgi:EpsI family protein
MKKQFWFIAFILVVAIIYLKVFATIEAVPLPANIDNFPKQIGLFTMTGSSALTEEVLQELKVSSYINREYRNNDGYQLSLYLGYYEEQREGAMIHSPRNCMPGSGWNPVETSVVTITISGTDQSYKVNRILFQKGMDKILMHYWYQGRNRIVANEYIDRLFLILDSILQHRSEGSLVRVIGPWDTSGDFEQKQEQFVASLFPLLQQHLPQ